jgi:retron-type reverse transcriptase
MSLPGSGWSDDSQATTRLWSGAIPRSLSRTAATIPHNLIKLLIGLRVAFHLRLIQKWLRAGILEDEVVTIEEKGTGQGSVISPLLANVYLHYVFDLWAARWRRREATGDMIMVRYADDSAPRRREEEALM